MGGCPVDAKSLVLIIDDPDAPDPKAPKMVRVHWVVYNIPSDTRSLPESAGKALCRMGSPWRDRRSLRAFGAPPQRPGTSPCRTRQGLVPYEGLFGGLRHHHASGR